MKKAFLLFLFLLVGTAWTHAHWKTRDFSMVTNFNVKCDSGCTRLRFLMLIPRTHPGVQEVHSTSFNIQPAKVYTEHNTTFAEFNFEHPARDFTITVKTEGRLYNNDYASNLRQPPVHPDSLAAFLQSTQMCEADSPQIRALAGRIMKRKKSAIGRIGDIWSRVHGIKYVYGPPKSALEMLRSGEGCCTGKSNLFIALCRACGIPARLYSGIAAREAHAWPEAYVDGRGWVKFEPTHTDETDYKRINGSHIRLSDGRFTFMGMDTDTRYRYWYWGTAPSVDEAYQFVIYGEED